MRKLRNLTMLGALAAAAFVIAAALGARDAQADRGADEGERDAIAATLDVKPKCVKARISTVTQRPRWAGAKLPAKRKCWDVTTPGIYVLHRSQRQGKGGGWRYVTLVTGEDRCDDEVPRRVIEDLNIFCLQRLLVAMTAWPPIALSRHEPAGCGDKPGCRRGSSCRPHCRAR